MAIGLLIPSSIGLVTMALIANRAKKGRRLHAVKKYIGEHWKLYLLATLAVFMLTTLGYIGATIPATIQAQQGEIFAQSTRVQVAFNTQTAQAALQETLEVEYEATKEAIFEQLTLTSEPSEAKASYDAWLFEDFTLGTLRRSLWMPLGCPLSNRLFGTFGYLGFSLDESVWQCSLSANLDDREVRTIVVDFELLDTRNSTGFLGIETSCGPNKIYLQLHDTQVVFKRDQEESKESFYHDLVNPRVRLEMRWLDRGVIDLNIFDAANGTELRVLPEITCRALPEYIYLVAYREAGDFNARIYSVELSSQVKD